MLGITLDCKPYIFKKERIAMWTVEAIKKGFKGLDSSNHGNVFLVGLELGNWLFHGKK